MSVKNHLVIVCLVSAQWRLYFT